MKLPTHTTILSCNLSYKMWLLLCSCVHLSNIMRVHYALSYASNCSNLPITFSTFLLNPLKSLSFYYWNTLSRLHVIINTASRTDIVLCLFHAFRQYDSIIIINTCICYYITIIFKCKTRAKPTIPVSTTCEYYHSTVTNRTLIFKKTT